MARGTRWISLLATSDTVADVIANNSLGVPNFVQKRRLENMFLFFRIMHVKVSVSFPIWVLQTSHKSKHICLFYLK